MSASMYAAGRSLRPTGLSPEVRAKIVTAQARSARNQRIRAIREGLALIADIGAREWERRRVVSVGGGADVPRLLLMVNEIEANFDELMKELGQ